MLTNARLAHQPHNHSRCMNAALARAEQICRERNARLTPTRELVLKLIWQNHRPIGAYQIQDELTNVSGKTVAPPTIYRAIKFLLSLGLIHKIPSLNAFIGCPFPTSMHSNLFMICEYCGSAAEVSHAGINKLLQAASDQANFFLQSQSLELFGTCMQCTNAGKTTINGSSKHEQ
mgnify:CR=1 FL=1